MTTEEFVRNFRIEKDRLLEAHLSGLSRTAVGHMLQSMNLTPNQTEAMRGLLNQILTDAFYTILLGLDGCCGIGDAKQQTYQIRSEDGSSISGAGGEIETLAYEYFQSKA